MTNKFSLLKHTKKENGSVDTKPINYTPIHPNKFIVFHTVRYMIHRESFWVVGKIVEGFILFTEYQGSLVPYTWFTYHTDLGSHSTQLK